MHASALEWDEWLKLSGGGGCEWLCAEYVHQYGAI